MSKLVVEGDSMTAVAIEDKWPKMLTGRVNVPNFAWGGDRVAYMEGEYVTEAHILKPTPGEDAWFALWAGTNDLIHGNESAAQIFAHIKKIWTMARADGYKVLAFTVLPSTKITPIREGVRLHLNSYIAASYRNYDALVRPDIIFPKVTSTYFYTDGVHLNQAGQKKIAAAVMAALPAPDGVVSSANVVFATPGNSVVTSPSSGTQMWGSSGNNTYYVTGPADKVWEGKSAGKDWVVTPVGVSYALQPHSEIEVLEVANVNSTIAITLTGNESNNVIYGGAGDDTIGGGGGVDRLYGGAGKNTYVLTKGGMAYIYNFVSQNDLIKLSGFGLATGHVVYSDQIAYDRSTGKLTVAGVLVAVLVGKPALNLWDDIWKI